MRSFLALIFLIIFVLPTKAQDVSNWIGYSNNPDPITRHHEAFMSAFSKYVEQTSNFSGTCRMEISSNSENGSEKLTLSIGCGQLVTYEYVCMSVTDGSESSDKTRLLLKFNESSGSHKSQSFHVYTKETLKDTIGSSLNEQFTYECSYSGIQY